MTRPSVVQLLSGNAGFVVANVLNIVPVFGESELKRATGA